MRPAAGRLVDHLLRQVDRVEHHLVEVLARFLQLRDQMSSRTALSSLPRNCLFRIVRRAPQLVGAVVALELQDAVLHFAAVDDQDREHAVVGQRHELDLAERA